MAQVYSHINTLKQGDKVHFNLKPESVEYLVLLARPDMVLFGGNDHLMKFVRNVNYTSTCDLYFYVEVSPEQEYKTTQLNVTNTESGITHSAISDPSGNIYPVCGNRFNVGTMILSEYDESQITCGSCLEVL